MDKKIYLLIASLDEGVMEMYPFRANHLLEVAEHIVQNKWQYLKLFERLKVVHHYDTSWQYITAEQLLELIQRTRIDGDSDYGFTFHVISPEAVPDVPPLYIQHMPAEQISDFNQQVRLDVTGALTGQYKRK